MEKPVLSRISKIALAFAFSFVICGTSVRSALADDHHGGGGDRNGGGDWGRGAARGPVGYAPQPDYYYAPQPNYYYAPEPDYYYPPQPQYAPPPPTEGILLFFGL
jgi:hypothetical protein